MKKFAKLMGMVSGIIAIIAIAKKVLAVAEEACDDDWDDEYDDEEDIEETLSACDEAYDRGYLHGIRGLPYAGKNAVALTLQDIAAAETMAMYDDIVQENLHADITE